MTDVDTPTIADPFGATAAGERVRIYAELARRGPVCRIPLPIGPSAWLVTGRDEARRVLTDPRVVKGPPINGPLVELLPAEVRDALFNHMLYRNPPDHTRLRALVGAAFTRRRVESLEPRIQRIADDLLDALGDAGETELVDSYAYPLPMTVICELIGVPDADRDDFRRWSRITMSGHFVGAEAYVCGMTEMAAFVRGLIEAKRAAPTDDLLSALIQVRQDGDRLSENELIGMVGLLVVAGHETTVNLISGGVHSLLTHPDQLALLCAEPHRLPAAVEEMLRLASPLQVSVPNLTTAPLRVGDTVIPAGEIVLVGLLAANRDPSWASDPDRLDIGRGETHHVAFGHGIHHCVGAPLARLEGRIAIGTLLERFPALRLAVPAEDLTWAPQLLMNGLTALPVALR